MKRLQSIFFAATILAVAFVVGCSDKQTPATPAGKADMGKRTAVLMLKYQETEPGVDPYVTRILISSRFIRFDDDKANSDFVLFDRKLRTIYSVGHDNQAILVVHHRKITEVSPVALKAGTIRESDPKAPRVGGRQAHDVKLLVNGKVCRRMYVVPGMLPEAVRALTEFRKVLAGKLASNIPKTPVNMQDPCFLQYEVFASSRKLQFGMPIQEWKNNNSSRSLVDYNQQFPVMSSIFRLPEDYRRYSVGKTGMKNEPTS